MAKEQISNGGNFIDARIHTIQDERVMFDSDLAAVYEVLTKALNQAVDRNERRFPPEFAFRLPPEEWGNLKSQSVTSSSTWGGRRTLPRAFTEHGAVMPASVLNSERAVAASIQVVHAFVRFRRVMESNRDLARRIDELNIKFEKRTSEDNVRFNVIFQKLKRLALEYDAEEVKPKGRIGFRTSKDASRDKAGMRARKKRQGKEGEYVSRNGRICSTSLEMVLNETIGVKGEWYFRDRWAW